MSLQTLNQDSEHLKAGMIFRS